MKKIRQSKYAGAHIQGRRLFSGGEDNTAANGGNGAAGAMPLNSGNGAIISGLNRLESGTGPFKLELDPTSKMLVPLQMSERDKFSKDFDVIEKIGEGEFGIAYKVRCKNDGTFRAVKKQKEKYVGVRDTDSRRQEVAKAF